MRSPEYCKGLWKRRECGFDRFVLGVFLYLLNIPIVEVNILDVMNNLLVSLIDKLQIGDASGVFKSVHLTFIISSLSHL